MNQGLSTGGIGEATSYNILRLVILAPVGNFFSVLRNRSQASLSHCCWKFAYKYVPTVDEACPGAAHSSNHVATTKWKFGP